MKTFFYAGIIALMTLSGCISEYIYQNDQRYATPGALDSSLSGIYNTYKTHFLGKYRITLQWFESGCRLRSLETPRLPDGRRSHFYVSDDIIERDGKTYQIDERGKYDIDRFVRSVISKRTEYKDINGQIQAHEPREEGYRPLCFEYWQRTSSYMRVLFQKRNLSTLKKIFNDKYPEAHWSQKRLGGNTWTVQEVSEKGLREEPSDGSLGGPYQNWFLPIGDTGYTMAFEFGANRKTLENSEAFDELKGVFKHLLESVKVESI